MQLKLAKGFLVETDEEPTANTHRHTGTIPEGSEARWLKKRGPNQKIIPAPPRPAGLTPPRRPDLPTPPAVPRAGDLPSGYHKELAAQRKRFDDLALAVSKAIDELREQLAPVIAWLEEHGPQLHELLATVEASQGQPTDTGDTDTGKTPDKADEFCEGFRPQQRR